MIEIAGITIDTSPVDDALFGTAHRVLAGDRELTRISVIDWSDPAEVPAIAAPGRLPPGTGGAVMNVLAQRARRPLRYAGPYPTPALYRTLLRSFRTTAPEDRFTADLVERMATLSRDPIPIDFIPAPHLRRLIPGGHAEVRDGLERVVLDGIAFDPDGSPARLIEDRAEIWFGDRCYARVATLSALGTLLAGPHAIPPSTSEVIGKRFPPDLVAALAELIGDAVPPPLAARASSWLREQLLVWADLGGHSARHRDQLEIHAAIWDTVSPQGLARLALAIIEAIAPIATAAVIGELAG